MIIVKYSIMEQFFIVFKDTDINNLKLRVTSSVFLDGLYLEL